MKVIILIASTLLFIQCVQPQNESKTLVKQELESIDDLQKDSIKVIVEEEKRAEDRIEILKRLSKKIESQEPLIVHLFVPLCDNDNQGIVPTSASLGNGLDLKRNLYWATSKGVKRYYTELPEWKVIDSRLDIDSNVLERVIFKKKYKNSAVVYLIADAYRGDRMNACLSDYFNSLSGNKLDSILIEDVKYEVSSNADLLIFNGHNGLMDGQPDILPAKSHLVKDAVSIACISGDYFRSYYEYTNSFPLVNTSHLLFPGAFISEEIINKWAELGSAEECKIAAGKSYYKHKPNSGPNGSQNLFNFGWNF